MSVFLNINLSTWNETYTDFHNENIQMLLLANDYLIFVVFSAMGIFGCMSNMVNFVMFFQQGRRECITVCLFALGVSDFCCCCTLLVFSLLYSHNFINNHTIIDPVALDVMAIYPAGMFYDISEGITAFISLQRCLCVAMPIRFKNVFTVKLSLIIIFAIYAFTIGAFTPHYNTCGVFIKFDYLTNKSIVALWTSADRATALSYLNYIVHIGLDAVYQIVIVVSASVMIAGLIRSSKFRQQEMKHSFAKTPSEHPSPKRRGHESKHTTTSETHRATKSNVSNLSNKNVNVVKTILALTILAIACNTERLCAMYGMTSVPGLNADPKTESIFLIVLHLTFLVNMINASMNVFVYYNFNPSYRRTFLKIFRLGSRSEAPESWKARV